MNSQQIANAALLFSRSVAALAEIGAMRALNQERESRGHSLGYGEDAFLAVIDKWGLEHNAVLITLRQGL
mgnify:CR=1